MGDARCKEDEKNKSPWGAELLRSLPGRRRGPPLVLLQLLLVVVAVVVFWFLVVVAVVPVMPLRTRRMNRSPVMNVDDDVDKGFITTSSWWIFSSMVCCDDDEWDR